jgi:predicted nucleic acid-binding protein
MADGTFAGCTSVLTLMEVAIKPLRLGRPEIADAYAALLEDIPNLAIVPLDTRSARIGAELRAEYGLRTPDALHIAACLAHGAQAFVTNDRRLRRVNEIEVVVLDDFL